MHYDALTAACMAAELQRLLAGGRVQTVVAVDTHSLGLEVYAGGERRQLLLAAPPAGGRIYLAEHKLRRGVEGETPLLLLARKYLRDAVLVAAAQPDPYERVLHLAFRHKEHGLTTLVVELIGRQSNLLLLREDGRILDCLHRHPGGEEGGRVLLPGKAYAPPPAQDKLPPLDNGRPDYYEQLAAVLGTPGKLAKALGASIAGLSPTAAREVAWRAAGDGDAPAAAANVLALAAALQALWEPLANGAWQPGLLRNGEQVIGFTTYAAHSGGEWTSTPTLSAALVAYYAAASAASSHAGTTAEEPARGRADWTSGGESVDPYAAQRAETSRLLQRARRAVERRLAALAGDEPPPGAAAGLRTQAEWLLALSHAVAPGQARLEVPLDGEMLVITLDGALGPVEQAQALFRRAARLERAAAFIPQRRAELEQDLLLLDQLMLDLARAANQPEIAAVGRDLAAAGLLAAAPGSKPGPGKAGATSGSGGLLRLRSRQGLEIVIGRNARQNERVTFDEAHPDDLWLHARNVPGAHVVIRGGGQTPDAATIHLAAQWAAYHSAARGDAAVAVTVTRKRWVSRAPGGKLGQVLVKQEDQVMTVAGVLPDERVSG
jgi:predicted ribosome quality control (RQC) complex YloA/Tae2 family protein